MHSRCIQSLNAQMVKQAYVNPNALSMFKALSFKLKCAVLYF